MTLWLVRHAQVLMEPGTCYGAMDVAADPNATRQCAKALATVLPPNAAVSASPLQRCAQLAQVLIGLRPDLTLQTDARLKEMNFGDWEGKLWDHIARTEFDQWMGNFADHAVGGHGESTNAVMERVAQAFDELPSGRDSVWITHAGIIRSAQLVAQGIRQVTDAGQWPVEGTGCGHWRCLTL
ncbi:MAG TPA: histidine phosphatase family protein [Polaromonas sp.]|uniref:histidine phosphatase family protein n=1 Tax=Polaromonas sp. TaxID=1869339 RepID=UPI002D609B79|nr:histidine phosphatase family protein [Polaromonas sp.]HYW56107.1 histidine phosphatase family protein [Polaromonas sp.]